MTIENITDVENFLSDFVQKKKVWQIRFVDRVKNQPVICISFHPSESPMRYPFKSL